MQAERETFWWCMDNCNEYFKLIEDDINGMDMVVCYEKIEARRKKFFDLLYTYNTLYKVNNFWILQGMSLMSSFTGIGIALGSAAFSIRAKFTSPTKISFAGADMALANQLSRMSSSLVYGMASLEIQVRMAVVTNYCYVRTFLCGTSTCIQKDLTLISRNHLQVGRQVQRSNSRE